MRSRRQEESHVTSPSVSDTRGLQGLAYGQLIRVAISPDGAHMLYAASRSGRDEIYCVEWPSGEGIQQVSTEGGRKPMWSPDGSRVIFRGPDDVGIVEVDVIRDDAISFSRPRRIFPDGVDTSNYPELHPSHDGSRFVTVRLRDADAEQDPYYVSIIENWDAPFRE